jgi:hypothetical protein
MITITSKPFAPITGDDGNISKWVGAHQPIEFKAQRKDYDVKKVWNETHGGVNFKVLELNGTISELRAGTKFTFICTLNVRRSWSVVADSVFFGNNKTFVFINRADLYDDYLMNQNQATILVERKGYFIETFVYKAKENYQLELIGVLKSKNDVWGVANVNIQKVISSSLKTLNEFGYDKINAPIPNQGGIYNVKMREVYDGFIGNFTSLLSTDNLYYVNGSKQIQEENNYNFGEFVPSLNNSRTNKAKFLSVFNKPTYFNNYPFSLSFVYSDLMLNKQLKRNEDSVLTNLFVQGRGFVNRLMVTGSYPTTTKEINVHIEEDGTTTQNPTTGTGTYTTGNVFSGYTEIQVNKAPRDRFEDLFDGLLQPNRAEI